MSYDPSTASILLVDPCNNFPSDGGTVWLRAKAVAEQLILTTDELIAHYPA